MKTGASTRRVFLQKSFLGTAGALAGWRTIHAAEGWPVEASPAPTSRVALTAGNDRADNAFRALQMFRREIAAAIGQRRVIVKANLVSVTRLLAATHPDCLEGVLEFLKSIGKTNVIIAESSAEGLTMDGYAAFGYSRLPRQYPVRLMDLNQEEFEVMTIWNGAGTRTVRVSKVLLDPRHFVISVPRMKTHDCVVATLALKNIVMGAPMIDVAYHRGRPGGSRNDKSPMHGTGNQDLNDNLHRLAPRLVPDLAVLDGFEGMEGNGPTGGTAVNHRVCVAGLDWLAAERVAVELMGIPANYLAYLDYCHQTGLGEYDLAQIEVLGEPVADHIVTYRLHSNVSTQLNMRATPRT